MNKSASAGAVGSSTKCQGIPEESRPPVHCLIGRQTSYGALEAAGAHELAPALLSHSLGKRAY